MEKQFLNNLKPFFKSATKNPILLAISGGIDSVVMSHLFYLHQIPFAIAHCNFKLRAQESDEDEEFVKKLSLTYKVPFHSTTFETEKYANENKISIQMAARDLRYHWFEEIRYQFDYSFVATAHHKNDVIETFLLNLTRGTGIAGLQGIQIQIGNIVRPMLFASKDEIELYAMNNNLEWREDSSNESDKYARNLIRHKVIPILQQINPKLENTFQNNIKRIKEASFAFESAIQNALLKQKKVIGEKVFFRKSFLLKQNPSFIYELIKEYGFNYIDACTLLKIMNKQSGKILFSKEFVLLVDRKEIIISKISENIPNEIVQSYTPSVIFGDTILFFERETITNHKKINFSLKPKNEEWIDEDVLDYPLLIRSWESGDKLVPLGMNSYKKVSDILIDKKIPLNEKSKIPVMISNFQIFAIPGIQIDERFKISRKTKKILKIIITNSNIN
ncbi:MAG: tRNA lysidine(34) synthetase TilS [Bacteroidota bacterium]|nr:tRNA lysidine(34) synthetase TilS [Bacteroidota bacterium]